MTIIRDEGKRRVYVERFGPAVLSSDVVASLLSEDHDFLSRPPDPRNTLDTQPDTYQPLRSPPPEEEKETDVMRGNSLLPEVNQCPRGSHFFLCSEPLGVSGFFVTLHADGVKFDNTLSQWNQIQNVTKRLQIEQRLKVIVNTAKCYYTNI